MIKPGDRFGDYTVERLLGKGGMGEVWLLRSPDGGLVAAKFLDASAVHDHESRRRFVNEAELALGVQHPHTVATYDVGEDPDTGLCYILMEYIPGGSLEDLLRAEGVLSVEQSLAIIKAMASVLELAEEKGIVHRDIKPANIMFEDDGTPKLADLGIALCGRSEANLTTVTQAGVMIGTPAYMSPEQMLDSHAVDIRADIYSLGVVFFEMLTGERPHQEDSVVQLMAKVIAGEAVPNVRTIRPDVPLAVANLIARMTEPDVADRISSPQELLAVIERIEQHRSVASESPRRRAARLRRQRRILLTAAIVSALFMSAVGALVYWRFFVAEEPPAAESVPPQTNEPMPLPEVTPPAPDPAVQREDEVDLDDPQRNEVPVKPKEAKPELAVGNRGDDLRSGMANGRLWTYREVKNGISLQSAMKHGDTKTKIDPIPEGRLEIPERIDGKPVICIGECAFAGAEDLEEVVIPEGVQEINGWWVFHGCTKLKRVTVPKSLRRIYGWGVFMKCPQLEQFDIGMCGDVDPNAFCECPALKSFLCDPTNPYFTVHEGAIYLKNVSNKPIILVRAPLAKEVCFIPYGVMEIGRLAFKDCRKLESVDIPSSAKRISDLAFQNCTGLKQLSMPVDLTNIAKDAFAGCTNSAELLKRNLTAPIYMIIAGYTIICPNQHKKAADAFFDMMRRCEEFVPKVVDLPKEAIRAKAVKEIEMFVGGVENYEFDHAAKRIRIGVASSKDNMVLAEICTKLFTDYHVAVPEKDIAEDLRRYVRLKFIAMQPGLSFGRTSELEEQMQRAIRFRRQYGDADFNGQVYKYGTARTIVPRNIVGKYRTARLIQFLELISSPMERGEGHRLLIEEYYKVKHRQLKKHPRRQISLNDFVALLSMAAKRKLFYEAEDFGLHVDSFASTIDD